MYFLHQLRGAPAKYRICQNEGAPRAGQSSPNESFVGPHGHRSQRAKNARGIRGSSLTELPSNWSRGGRCSTANIYVRRVAQARAFFRYYIVILPMSHSYPGDDVTERRTKIRRSASYWLTYFISSNMLVHGKKSFHNLSVDI